MWITLIENLQSSLQWNVDDGDVVSHSLPDPIHPPIRFRERHVVLMTRGKDKRVKFFYHQSQVDPGATSLTDLLTSTS